MTEQDDFDIELEEIPFSEENADAESVISHTVTTCALC